MKATEYLPPGRGGPDIGLDLNVDLGPVPHASADEQTRARRFVAGCARDADDARLLLEHLNLLPAVPAAPDQAETPS